jgi:hypothetical protein
LFIQNTSLFSYTLITGEFLEALLSGAFPRECFAIPQGTGAGRDPGFNLLTLPKTEH